MSVQVRDRGAKALLKVSSMTMRIKVGVIGTKAAESHQGGQSTVAQIAEQHELGLGVPERSFLRAYIDQNEPQIHNDMRAAWRKILLGRLQPSRAANVLGIRFAAGVQEFISSGKVTPSLSPLTIRLKGSSIPLIDTGQLRSAITYTIVELDGVKTTSS